MYYVYILKCENDTFYVGCTKELEDRLKRHKNGYIESTKKRLPVKLIVYTVFKTKYLAYNFEKYLKTGSGRAFLKRHFI